MSLPLTILMPVYNAEATVRGAIESILQQTHQDWTLLCLDDGSTDCSWVRLNEYLDPRIHLTGWRENKGLSATLNHGLSLCKTEWVARMDADDIMSIRRLERQTKFLLKTPNTVLLGTWGWQIDCYQYSDSWRMITKPIENAEIRKNLRWGNPFIHSSVMFRKDDVLKCGGYDPSYKYCPDFALWRKMARLFPHRPMANLPYALTGYRCHHAGSLTARYPIRRFTEQIRLLWDYPL